MPWTRLFSKKDLDVNTEQSTRKIGEQTEAIASDYLKSQGLSLIEKNYHCRGGEVDLIMQEQDTLVFVEVKYRQSTGYGGAAAAVSATKQKKIKHCVTFYLHQKGLNEYNTPCRLDVVTLEGNLKEPHIHWFKNAF